MFTDSAYVITALTMFRRCQEPELLEEVKLRKTVMNIEIIMLISEII